jgi:hypothetical protein
MCSQRRTRSAIRSPLSFGAGHLQRPRNDPGHVRPAICRRTSLLDPGGRDRHLAGSRRPTGEGPALPAAPAVVSIMGEQMPAGGLDLYGCLYLAQLALVEEDHGHRVALEVARMLVVFLCRPGNKRSSVCRFANNAPTTALCGISKFELSRTCRVIFPHRRWLLASP